MQIMFGTILCVLLKGLMLTETTNTPKNYITSNILQEESTSICPDLNLTKDISMFEKSDHHILNLKSDRSHSDNTRRNEREVDEVSLANISIIPKSNESSLIKPTSLRAFVQFDSPFTEKVNDIFVTLRWNQPNVTDEIIQGYQVQCSLFEDFKETCDDKNITATELKHTVHNLTSNMTYYFRVRAHTKIVAGSYTDLINVSTTHENPIPKLLFRTNLGIKILDVDLNIYSYTIIFAVPGSTYVTLIQEHSFYWSEDNYLGRVNTYENMNEYVYVDSFNNTLHNICIDWVARNLYFTYDDSTYFHIVKFDLTKWENGISFEEILKQEFPIKYLNVLPSMGILYYVDNSIKEFNIRQYDLDRQNEQIVQINASSCLFHYKNYLEDIKIDNINNEEPLIYWLSADYIFVTDINISMCNTILHKDNLSDKIRFQSMTIDKTNIYILNEPSSRFLYILKKKYASLKSVNAAKYVEKITISSDVQIIEKIDAFDKSVQPYPPVECLTPYEKVYDFDNVTATENSIIVHFPEPVVKSGCKKYNLPTTIYTISVSHNCFGNLNNYEIFDLLRYVTFERYYEIQNLTSFTKYKLKFTLSNFYFDQLSINPFESKVKTIKTEIDNLNAPENLSVRALTPTIAVVHWMPPKNLNCADLIYEVYWRSVILVNGMQEKSDQQVIDVPKRMADGRFFTKINLSLPVKDYLIYVGVYPNDSEFSLLYAESLSKIVYRFSEPNNITLDEVDINSMKISWISNINWMISFTLEYKDIAAEKWQTMNYIKMMYKDKETYYVKNLQSGTSYKFRLILRYVEYEETFIWPADERFTFATRDNPSNSGIIAIEYYLLLMLSFIVIVPIICVFYIYRLYRQSRGNNEQFFSSTMTDVELGILHEESWRSTLDECAITKIARNQIKLTKHLGSGAFGTVYHGKVKDLEESGKEISVAIKTLRKDASFHEKEKLLKEARLMNHIQHKHILRLLAVSLDGDSPLLVLELMETDLLKYLGECQNLHASDSLALRLLDLFSMCEDVARGCCYLEELRLVHRDLACRNCLVSSRNRENRVIKIGDFGLARNIYKDDYYRIKGEPSFPIRWMAPESLMIKKFTSKSDVWSFGVLMWEITSLGEQPYSDKSNKEVINYVRAGGRLPITPNCPSPLYQLMLSCWSAADARPNFERCLKNIITLKNNIDDTSLSPVDII